MSGVEAALLRDPASSLRCICVGCCWMGSRVVIVELGSCGKPVLTVSKRSVLRLLRHQSCFSRRSGILPSAVDVEGKVEDTRLLD